MNHDIKITVKLSPQGLYYFEAECDKGRWHHVSNQLRRTAEQALGLVSELVAGEVRNIKAFIITGGGGIILEDWIKERYKRAYLTDNPIMANALGFARYGRRKWTR